jgi:putative membrane protein
VKSIAVKIGINALALWAAAYFISGVQILVAAGAPNATKEKVITLLIVAVIFAVVNTLVKPLVKLLTFPLFFLTLGLITFVINALMLLLTSKICENFQVSFHVTDFKAALLGSLVITVVSLALHALLPDDVQK